MSEAEILSFWKKIAPSSLYSGGLKEYEGKMFVASRHAVESAVKEIDVIAPNASHKEKKLLESVRASLKFEEPGDGPSSVQGILYIHLVKQAPKDAFLKLAEACIENLDAYLERLSGKKWELPAMISVANKCNSAKMIVEIVEKNHDIDLSGLKEKIAEYKKVFDSGIEGGFEEIYPKLDGVSITGRKDIYGDLLKKLYDYSEGPEEIEKRAKEWMDQELPRLEKLRERLADIYGCSPDKVDEELQNRHRVEKENLVPVLKRLREPLKNIVHRRIVSIFDNYNTHITVTPPYLRTFIPTAAMQSFDKLTDEPFNIFFSTPNEFQNFVDLFQTLVHEEYGHCVNFSNSARNKESVLDIIDSSLDVPITEGISFNRELEMLEVLRDISGNPVEQDEKEIRSLIEERTDMKTFIFEYEYVVLKWRVTRFIRAIYDVRINMGHPIKEFIEDAHKKTKIPKKWIFNQTFGLYTPPGYTPAYSIVGQRIAEMQDMCREKGKDVREFNTLACSMGFPARTIWEERLMEWINA